MAFDPSGHKGTLFPCRLISPNPPTQVNFVRFPCAPPNCANLDSNAKVRNTEPPASALTEVLAVFLPRTTAPATMAIARGNPFQPSFHHVSDRTNSRGRGQASGIGPMREQEGDSKLPWEREGRAEEWYLRRGGLSIAKEAEEGQSTEGFVPPYINTYGHLCVDTSQHRANQVCCHMPGIQGKADGSAPRPHTTK